MITKREQLNSAPRSRLGRSPQRTRRHALLGKWALLTGGALSSACGDDGPTQARNDDVGIAGTGGFAGTQAPSRAGNAGGSGGPSGSAGAENHGGLAGSGSIGADAGKSGAGSGGHAGTFGIGGAGVGGTAMVAGTGGTGTGGNVGGTGGSFGGTGGNFGGTCCTSGDCLCHGPAPTALTSSDGPFATATFTISTGTVHYPTDAEPPFAAVALCGGFLNTGPEMAPWGTFYASHGIVTIITTTTGADLPDLRATKLLASIEAIKAENTRAGSPLSGKLAGRYGTSGYSMGGGGTTLASVTDPSLRSSIGLAPWAPVGENVRVPTLLLCGAADGTAPCSMAESAYAAIPAATPKMIVTIAATGHLAWFGPAEAGGGVSGETALAFQKVFLEGDERWRPFLLQGRGAQTTTIE
jgi:pimeloyl-ACP methyl ester carboxylesterase